jgi:hypothetical protein
VDLHSASDWCFVRTINDCVRPPSTWDAPQQTLRNIGIAEKKWSANFK